MSDLISRQAAIDGFYEMASDIDHLCTVGDYISFLESLSAQPEIIRCKDCKRSYDDIGGRICSYGFCTDCVVGDDFYCADAERITDDEG